MIISGAKYIGGQLILETMDADARKLVYNFKPGDYQLVKAKKPRSLNANAMCWQLCTEIAKAVGVTKEEVYRDAIKSVGEYTPLPIREDAIEEFNRIWAGHGTGWFVEIIDDSKLPGYKLCFAYQGSSVYTVEQMSRLIDLLMQDAEALGIDTLTEREKSLLLEEWGK